MRKNNRRAGRLLDIYERVLSGELEKYKGRNRDYLWLCLSGLVYNDKRGFLKIRSNIYKELFTQDWIDEHRYEIRQRSGYHDALIGLEKIREE